MGRIWGSINASNQHMLTHVPNGQIAGSPLCYLKDLLKEGLGEVTLIFLYFLALFFRFT